MPESAIRSGRAFIEGGAWDKIKQGRPEFYDKTLAQVPLGRLGDPDEVANAIAFLCSPVASFITGTNLVIDGGMTRRIQF